MSQHATKHLTGASAAFEGYDDLEKELQAQLANVTMDSLFNESVQNFKEGEVVRGRVMEIGPDRILVDIGYKSEGVVGSNEFPRPEDLNIGDEFDFYIEDPENEADSITITKLRASST